MPPLKYFLNLAHRLSVYSVVRILRMARSQAYPSASCFIGITLCDGELNFVFFAFLTISTLIVSRRLYNTWLDLFGNAGFFIGSLSFWAFVPASLTYSDPFVKAEYYQFKQNTLIKFPLRQVILAGQREVSQKPKCSCSIKAIRYVQQFQMGWLFTDFSNYIT